MIACFTRSICQQICYTDMLPFEDIPDDTVPVTAYLKELLQLATDKRPLLIFLDSVDELTGSQVTTDSPGNSLEMSNFLRMRTRCPGCH